MRLFVILIFIAIVSCGRGSLRFDDSNDYSSSGIAVQPESRLRMGSRFYVASTLNEIFGTSAETVTSSLVMPNINQFGGPCDPYIENDCTEQSQSQAPQIPVTTSARAALTIRACERIVSADLAITTAIETVLGSLPAVLSWPTPENTISLFQLFYSDRIPAVEVQAALSGIVQAAQAQSLPPIEAWRFLLFTLCSSPDWQIP
jgi:hypothetical protein